MDFTHAFPTPHDMILAYRKVKAEIWWMKTVPSLRALAEYEADLEANLTRLRERLLNSEFDPTEDDFLGKAYHLPKKLVEDDSSKSSIHYCQLSDKPEHLKAEEAKWKDVELRLMAVPSIDFQILGVLWTMDEGAKVDAQREPSCRANILRREFVPEEGDPPEEQADISKENVSRGPINKRFPGVFQPYFSAYKKWRNDGLQKARRAVESGERVFALTLDLRRYFHQIDAKALRDLFPPKRKISKAFYRALEAWQDEFGEPAQDSTEDLPRLGIPVGLIASGVVANVFLQPLDAAIATRLSPIYYGRYVDDFFLVFSLNGSFPTGDSVLARLAQTLDGANGLEPILSRIPPINGTEELLQFDFKKKWGNSLLQCKASKQRLFLLEGRPGRDLLAVIDKELLEHSSEWRMVPDLDEDDDRWLREALVANHDASEGATSLRRTDDLSIRRLGVTVALRKLEALERFGLKPAEWKAQRKTFYRIAETHICSPSGLCDFWPNLPRLFGLLFANDDWAEANRILIKITEARVCFERISLRKDIEILGPWLAEVIGDEILRSPAKAPRNMHARRFFVRFDRAFHFNFGNEQQLRSGINDFKQRDLDRLGLRIRMRRGPSDEDEKEFKATIGALFEFFHLQEAHTPDCAPFGLLFPTRPLGEPEICLNRPATQSETWPMRITLFALRGQAMPNSEGGVESSNSNNSEAKGPPEWRYKAEFPSQSVRIAVTNYRTELSSWTDRVRKRPDLSFKRLRNLLQLVAAFLQHHRDSDWKDRPLYFCLPELSVPPEWIHEIAFFFSQAGVSLIAGVEYEFLGKKGPLNNPAYLFLRNRNLGYPATFLIRQFKTQAAPPEAQELWQEGNYTLDGPSPHELPVYVHGNFHFGVLICSELTNAEIHQHFRGYVDAIICLEWNRDIETFSALVEGAAQTIHAFIIQVNNRRYGDSRIRAPAKERFNRDIVRLNGGDHDYWVVGELPIERLRSFQRKVHSDLAKGAPYKPLPSGYDPHKFERLHPQTGEKEKHSENP